ncbi:MAG TPA: universal stress protein [Terriglobales bacterium]|nr:universal stress protein [Terriglobales bacterium]
MPVAEPLVQVAVQRILVATDFSEWSKRALLAGLGIAQRYASDLQVVHVVPSEGFGVAGAGMLGAVNFARHNARDLESEFLQKGYFEGIRYRISVEKGDVWPTVSRIAEEESVDLVVVGTHGRSGVGRLLLGSVAETIFRQSPCPVLTVGPNFEMSFPPSARPRSVLFPTDFSPQAEHALPYAVSLAQQHQAQLTFLHVVEPVGEATFNKGRSIRYASTRLEELMAETAKLTAEREFIVETGGAAEAIVKVAAVTGAELVVLGVRASATLSDRLGWSTAYGVVRQAHCPVLTVRHTNP